MQKNNSRGSEWRIWDLHIHTPKSIKQNYNDNEEGWEKFISSLENLPADVKVIGITDYYFIDGYEKVMDYKLNKNRLKNIEKIFPILEFRVDTFGTASESRLQKINLHILFDINEADLRNEINKVKSEFIGLIPITKLDRHKTKMLSIENFSQEAGGDLHEGFSNFIPPTEKVFELLNSTQWKGRTFLFLGYKEWSNLEKNQQLKPFKEDLYSRVDAFFSNNVATNQKNQSWLNEYGNKRLLHSLDIHGFDLLDTYQFSKDGNKVESSNYHCHTWIKSDPTFEGLKQIIYEPEHRVKIQSHKPDFKEDKLIIDSVKFISNNNLFNTTPIYLNQNLNVIIGGKSSGKSILLYNIAKTLETDTEVTDIVNSGYNFRNIDSEFDFEVSLVSGAKQKMYGEENSIIPNIKYIPQNYLSKLAEPSLNKKGSELLKYVRGLLREDPEYDDKYKVFLDRVKSNDNIREDIIKRYFSLKQYISEKEHELKELGNEEAIRKSIHSNSNRAEELKKGLGLTPEQIEDYNSKKKKLGEISSQISILNDDYSRFVSFSTELLSSLEQMKSKKELIEKSIINERVKNSFGENFNFISEKYNQIIELLESIKLNDKGQFVNKNFFFDLFSVNFENQKILNSDLEVYQKNDKTREEVSKIEKTIDQDSIVLQKISKLKNEIRLNKEELQKEKDKLFELYLKNYQEYPKIVQELSQRASLSPEEKLTIEGSVKFNADRFNKAMRNISDNRSFPEREFTLFQMKENLIVFDMENHLNQIKEIFSLIAENQKFPLATKYRNSLEDATRILLDDYFVDYWETIYDDDKMDKMSTGKASFVILMLIIGLSSAKAPILIDQPEDNLDNRSITKDLVEYLRLKKLDRQIILVTHNPNVVVNADAENVIVAHQKGQNDKETSSIYKFDYINGAIENAKDEDENEKDLLKSMGIRQHIADIVEGGKLAFQKREKKYSF
ncbi:MAG: TrlF family AAA-like ATPase [Bacteroidota bacterium]